MLSSNRRKAAFDALLPLANPTAAALGRVDKSVNVERKLMQPLRSGWTPTQFAAAYGLSRFNYGVKELGAAWEADPSVSRVSSDRQELGQMFLWALGRGWILRVKHEPVEGVAPGTQRLFEQGDLGVGTKQIFLTWTVSRAGNIVLPTFVCVEEPTFTIRLTQLLEAANGSPQSIQQPKPGANVRSTRPKQQDAERDES
jgi:hypothetical protein